MLIVVQTLENNDRFADTLIAFDEYATIKKILPCIYIIDTKLTPDQISRFDSVQICAKLTRTQVDFE